MLSNKPDWCVRIFGTVLILLVGALAWLSVPQQPAQRTLPDSCKTATEPKNNSKSDESSPNSPVVIGSQQTTPDQAKPAQEDQQISGKGDIPDYNCQLAIYTAQLATYTELLVGATILLGLIGAVQGFYMRSSVKLTESDTRAIQRAFLAVDPLGVQDFFRENPIARFRIKNTGHLPATKVRWEVWGAFHQNPRHEEFKIGDVLPGTNVIAPGAELNRVYEFWDGIKEGNHLRSADVGAFMAKKSTLYIWGIVHYRDGFGESRFIRFCHRYGHECIIQNTYDLSASDAKQHQFGNGTDEDE